MRLAANAGPQKVAKNCHLVTMPQLCRAISSQLRHESTIGEKFVKQQYLLYMSPQYGELGPLAADIVSLVWSTPRNLNEFRIEQRVPPIFGRATITLGIGPHSSFMLMFTVFLVKDACLFSSCRFSFSLVMRLLSPLL